MTAMTKVVLFGTEGFPVAPVAALLQDEGFVVQAFSYERDKSASRCPVETSVVFLAAPEPGVWVSGEIARNIRQQIGPKTSLCLCTARPDHADRELLKELGEASAIAPASWNPAGVAERIVGELIFHGFAERTSFGFLKGGTKTMRDMYQQIEVLSPYDEPILILGARGTGKELVANEIHRCSGRVGGLHAKNAASLEPERADSDLFGHKKGSFTSAIESRPGFFRAAGNGTAFLDEFAELSPAVQTKLLRALEQREVQPVGEDASYPFHARVVLATNRNLDEASEKEEFRSDLFDRVSGSTIRVPPLAERKGDLPLLASHFVNAFNQKYRENHSIPPAVYDILFEYDWPGNVRELRNKLELAAKWAGGPDAPISLIKLRMEIAGGRSGARGRVAANTVAFNPDRDSLDQLVDRATRAYFQALLRLYGGDVERAAQRAGIGRTKAYEIKRSLDLDS